MRSRMRRRQSRTAPYVSFCRRLDLAELWYVAWAQAAEIAEPQDEARATSASKLTTDEGMLDFREPALALHNKVWKIPESWYINKRQAGTSEEPQWCCTTR